MPRRPYNDVVTVSTNDGFGFPDTLRFSTPCRIVIATRILASNDPFDFAYGYFTYSGFAVFAGSVTFSGTGYFVDWTDADVIEFASLPGNRYVGLVAETVHPVTGSAYRRMSFADMP